MIQESQLEFPLGFPAHPTGIQPCYPNFPWDFGMGPLSLWFFPEFWDVNAAFFPNPGESEEVHGVRADAELREGLQAAGKGAGSQLP